LAAKIAAKKAAKEAEKQAGNLEVAKTPVPRKKKETKADLALGDLLDAGLSAGKKKAPRAK